MKRDIITDKMGKLRVPALHKQLTSSDISDQVTKEWRTLYVSGWSFPHSCISHLSFVKKWYNIFLNLCSLLSQIACFIISIIEQNKNTWMHIFSWSGNFFCEDERLWYFKLEGFLFIGRSLRYSKLFFFCKYS